MLTKVSLDVNLHALCHTSSEWMIGVNLGCFSGKWDIPYSRQSQNIFCHSICVWLLQVSKKKQNRTLSCWIAAIRNHFWYVCRECQGSEEEIRVCTWTTYCCIPWFIPTLYTLYVYTDVVNSYDCNNLAPVITSYPYITHATTAIMGWCNAPRVWKSSLGCGSVSMIQCLIQERANSG